MRVILLTVVLAGCFASPHAVVPDAPTPVQYVVSQEQCNAVAFAMLLDPGRTDAYLPAGYHARDASELYELPAAVGKHVLFVAAMQCEEISITWFSIYIDPPSHHIQAPASDHAFYDLHHIVSNQEAADAMQDVGWTVDEGTVDLTVEGRTGTAAITWFGGNLTGSALTEPDYDIAGKVLRFWQHEDKLVHFDVSIGKTVDTGYAQCQSGYWEFAKDLSTCESGEVLAVTVPDFPLNGVLERLA